MLQVKRNDLPKDLVGVIKKFAKFDEEFKRKFLLFLNKTYPNNFVLFRDALGIKHVESKVKIRKEMVEVVESELDETDALVSGCTGCKSKVFSKWEDLHAYVSDIKLYRGLFLANAQDWGKVSSTDSVDLAKKLFKLTHGVVKIKT